MRPAGFLEDMNLAVFDESPLHEVPGGWTWQQQGGEVQHGPWLAEDCAAVLRTWHAEGLLGLFYPVLPVTWDVAPAAWESRLTPERFLSHTDAAALLARPDTWQIERSDGHVCLCPSGPGADRSLQEWVAVIERDRAGS
jgi:hypothetical protein